MSDFDDYTPDVDLDIKTDIPEDDEWDLTDNEIDEILGKENTDDEGMGQGIGIKDDDTTDPKDPKKKRVKRFGDKDKKPQSDKEEEHISSDQQIEDNSVSEDISVEHDISTAIIPDVEPAINNDMPISHEGNGFILHTEEPSDIPQTETILSEGEQGTASTTGPDAEPLFFEPQTTETYPGQDIPRDFLYRENEPVVSEPAKDASVQEQLPEDGNFIHQKILVADADIQTTEAPSMDIADNPTLITSTTEEFYKHQSSVHEELPRDDRQSIDKTANGEVLPENNGFVRQHTITHGETMREEPLNVDTIPDKAIEDMVVPKTVAFFDSRKIPEVNNFTINNMPTPTGIPNYSPEFAAALQKVSIPAYAMPQHIVTNQPATAHIVPEHISNMTSAHAAPQMVPEHISHGVSVQNNIPSAQAQTHTHTSVPDVKQDSGFVNQHILSNASTFRGADGSMPTASVSINNKGYVEKSEVTPEITAKILPKGVCPKCGGLAGVCGCAKTGEGTIDRSKANVDPNASVKDAWGADYISLKGYNKGVVGGKVEYISSTVANGVKNAASVMAQGDTSDTAQGIRDAKNSMVVQTAQILLSTSGMGSVYQSMKYHSEDVAKWCVNAEKMIGEQKLSLDALSSHRNLKEHLKNGQFSKGQSASLFLHRKEIYNKLIIKDDLLKMPGLSDKEIAYIKSKDFFMNKNPKMYSRLIDRSFRLDKNVDLSAGISSLNAKGLKKLAKQDGLTSRQKAKLNDLAKAQKMLKAKKVSGRDRSPKKIARITKMVASRLIQSDQTLGKSLSVVRTTFNISKGAFRVGIKGAGLLLKVTGVSFITRKATGKVVGVVKQKVLKPMQAKASEGVRVTKKNIQSVKHTTVEKFSKTKPGQAIEQATNTIKNVGQHFQNTKPARFIQKAAKKTANAVKTTGKAASKTAKVTARIITAPFRALGKLVNVFHWIKVKIILIALIFVLAWVILYMAAGALIHLMNGASVTTEAMAETRGVIEETKELYESIIEYTKYKDMQDDIDMLLEEDEKTYEQAKELGEGHPITDEVLEGHHIDEYGCPDKDVGYTIHYMDAYGNEISSRASNVKDIEALCIAMVSNELGSYKGYKKDLKAFDDLLMDMYGMMVYHDPETGLPFTYEESEIYTCLEGCDEYFYYCNDYSYYTRYRQYIADGCGHYEDLVLNNPRGCCERTVTVDGYYYTNGDFYTEEECEQWEDPSLVDDLLEEGLFVKGVGYETEYYCPGHTVPICYGHRDIDIYITLYDVEYAINEDIYPEDWKNAKYRYMIQEFMKKGHWTNEWYGKIARNFFGGDWYELYGIMIEGAEFGTGDSLSDEEIEKILKEYGGDVSKARQALIEFGLKYVGKIKYGWGNKAGSGTPKSLDCSGFVNWVFKQALGVDVPASTAGWSGYKTKKYSDLKPGDLGFIFMGGSNASTGTYNHVGIYCGKNEAGQDLWLHCSSGGGGVVINTTNVFRKYVDPFAQ